MSAEEPVNILLVDDQPAKLLSYEAILAGLGERLIRANSAREALDKLLRNDIALILIDVVMPDLDGFELATMIREHPRFERTAIIFVSAVHMTDLDRLRGYEVGAVDYVPVPVVPDLLRAKVRVFADLHRKTRQLERLNAELERRVAARTAALEASTERLRQSEQRRSLALAAGHMGSWEWDLASGWQIWDEGQHRIFGTDPAGAAPTAEAALGMLHPDDRDRYRSLVAEAVEAGHAFDAEFRIQRPDGALRWCVVGGAPALDGAGRPVRISGVTHDITGRKVAEMALAESEERLRIAQETSGIGIWDWDILAERVIFTGDAYRHWGLSTRPGENHTELFQRIVHPEDQARVWAELQAALRGDRPYAVEFRIRNTEGGIRWLAGQGEVIRDATGRPVRMIGTDIDITERRRTAEILAEANQELERRVEERTREREAALAQVHEMQKLESLGQLTGGVAHDFNNLLMAMLGNLNLLRKRLPEEPRAMRLIDGAIQAAERGATLTKRMLAFARRQELKPKAVQVVRLVDGMADLLRRSLGPTITIRTEFPQDLPRARVDPNQLELALLNLSVNARDAMPGGGTVTISARPVSVAEAQQGLRPGAYIRIAVADTGLGMDEATLKRATEPFFTTKGVGKGTGLGLSMVHGLAAQSGGVMSITSAPGSGTEVELWLPVAEEQSVPAEQPASRPAEASGGAALRPCRVLMVDDDPLIRAGTADMLEDLGHTVIEAASAARALEALRAGSEVDLVVTDHAMPGMTGLELARRIEESWPGLPVMIATGYADLPEAEFGDRPRLAKPYRQEELAAAMERLLDRRLPGNVVPIEAARRA
ncbi:response regulator [Belnapia sp. T6]|uniref:histidine kinase n=1 Tax=Belnapia mucosa TaxID=2804532 RepID=A0ABS1V673_9PROT|nr:response regulator [Belnapia mucosa]MBL6457172.1 response regulator [Belnapia mucosa]